MELIQVISGEFAGKILIFKGQSGNEVYASDEFETDQEYVIPINDVKLYFE